MENNGFHGKKNVYICPDCGIGFVTIDADAGTTPFMTTCFAECGGMAKSLMYNVPQDWLSKPAVAWVRPPMAEWPGFKRDVREYLERGCLIRSDQIEKCKTQASED